MSYPNAFCVKCRTQTPTMKKHTVVLANSARAVTGTCQNCGCEVYKILPRKAEKARSRGASRSKRASNNVVRLQTNHRKWASAKKKPSAFDGTSFLIGAMAGVVLMLGIVLARLYS